MRGATSQPRTGTTGASSDAIQAHYDVGNEFYSLWLDETQTYSCALWSGEGDTLESAQERKLDLLVDFAKAAGAERVLDVGCGWGSLLRRMRTHHGVRHAHGITLSAQQARHIESQADPGIRVDLCDWRELTPAKPYDAIVSIGAFEHFARTDISVAAKRKTYRALFERWHAWLKPGGHAALQTITYENSTREQFSDFFREEIFPESDLPTLADLVVSAERLFEIRQVRSDREHYARTTRAWCDRLRAQREKAVSLAGEQTVARYERYLQLATIGFHVGSMGLVRLQLRRIDRPVAPEFVAGLEGS